MGSKDGSAELNYAQATPAAALVASWFKRGTLNSAWISRGSQGYGPLDASSQCALLRREADAAGGYLYPFAGFLHEMLDYLYAVKRDNAGVLPRVPWLLAESVRGLALDAPTARGCTKSPQAR